ncbi:neutral zinc metallopeptidase [Yoonia sp.]|uniref:neutral zinc metallopeptidase n=1 Tax=Yoonia sp. TaxID=2212373 RepID=UPI002FD8FFB5
MLCLLPLRLAADPVQTVAAAAAAAFDRMPQAEIVLTIAGQCGADASVHPDVAYCTSRNTILVAQDAAARPQTAYFLAHAYGHAVQVQHGVADVALREIRARPADEARLRGWVERQVDCIAGFVLSRAGLPLPDLVAAFAEDPLDRPHWGRSPLANGPHVPVPVAARAEWLASGYQGGLAACAVGEFDASLLIAALED